MNFRRVVSVFLEFPFEVFWEEKLKYVWESSTCNEANAVQTTFIYIPIKVGKSFRIMSHSRLSREFGLIIELSNGFKKENLIDIWTIVVSLMVNCG